MALLFQPENTSAGNENYASKVVLYMSPIKDKDNKKKPEEKVELSLDDLEGAAGGLIIDIGDGRYMTKDEFNGRIYYIGDSLGRAREVAMERDISTRVMTKSEFEKRSRR